MEALVILVVIVAVIMYLNKTIKMSLDTVTSAIETGARMSSVELEAVEADQAIRHAKLDERRATQVNDLISSKENRMSAKDILSLRREGKL